MKKKVKITKEIKEVLKEGQQGIKVDLGCGANKQEGFVGMDIRPLKGVDIVQNLEQFPWKLPDECASLVVASHVLEHINPASTDPRLVGLINLLMKKKIISMEEVKENIGEVEIFGGFIRFMDEVWRILKKKSRFAFVVPYAGSQGFSQDPTHINPINEATLAYFDPLDASGLYYIYEVAPWKIVSSSFNMHGNLEVVFEKRADDISYHRDRIKKYV